MRERSSNPTDFFRFASIILFLLGLVAAPWAPSSALAQRKKTATLQVKITGRGLGGVKVEVSGLGLTAPLEKKTNKKGVVKFTGLQPGTYTVTPRKTRVGFTPDSSSITFERAGNKAVRVRSRKLPAPVGETTCVACHQARNLDVVLDWIQGVHHSTSPVVGCESCHGGGQLHIKNPIANPVPYRSPTDYACGQCHNKDLTALYPTASADGALIYETYKASPHVRSINSSVLLSAKKGEVRAVCSKCHTAQGAELYKAVEGDSAALAAQLGGRPNVTGAQAVQCRSCHDPHDPSQLAEDATAATGSVTARSAQFNTCTNCHQLLDTASDAKLASPMHLDLAIGKTHFDDPATLALEGYNVNRASENACSTCHDPHAADTTINLQWAASGHADLGGEAWMHYDWKDNGSGSSTGRQACQRCHTATGFANRVTNPVLYDANVAARVPNNNFAHLTGLQNEVLYCSACHIGDKFERRPFPSVSFPSGRVVSLRDDSNLCMGCHQGRESKVGVDTKIAAAPASTNLSFTNVHYFAAAATFFGTETLGGYEYEGNIYAGQNRFPGHAGVKDTCVECHMRKGSADAPDHMFEPKIEDCQGCHNSVTNFKDIRPASSAVDYDADGNVTEGLQAEIETMEERLYAQIRVYGPAVLGRAIVYDPINNPYWFVDEDGDGIKEAEEITAFRFDAKLLKAAYNYQVSKKEPCGYIHNYRYMLQLLYDSIRDLGGDAAVAGLLRP